LRLHFRCTILNVHVQLFYHEIKDGRRFAMAVETEVQTKTEIQSELLPVETVTAGKIHQGDCIDLMQKIEAGTIDLVFADPPFNIGYEYDEYHDRQEDDEYVSWSAQWLAEVFRVLKPNGTFWLSIGDEFAAELNVAAKEIGFKTRSWVVWYYTFGVNCTKKFSRSHVHLFHFVKDENNYTFNADDPQVRVPSARALVYADKRANPSGRLPDDTWIVRPAADDSWVLRPQDLPDGFQPTDDTWYYARVAGTFKERKGFHGCQMPEQLLGRIVRTSSNSGDVVFDPFAGSGTTLAVAKKLDRKWMGCELSEEYVRAATERMSAVRIGGALDGPADPIASAPSTANGRRLTEAAEVAADQVESNQPTAIATVAAPTPAAAKSTPPASKKRDLREMIHEAIVESFFATHDGYSIDWMLAHPSLQNVYHDACRDAGLLGGPADWNRELLRLRKAGAIPKRDKTIKVHFFDVELDAFNFAAEAAWRLTSDRFDGPSLDEIFCDPEKAAFFDRTAKRLGGSSGAPEYRWAALRLRKASRDLVNEVKQYHFVFAKRDFTRFHAWDRIEVRRWAEEPGVYMLRDDDKQPLFIGRTLDLGRRLTQHDESRAVSENVAHVSVLTGADLPGEEYLDAFKEDLVRRHRPEWNVNLVGLTKAAID
jgi:DNA modification methylase